MSEENKQHELRLAAMRAVQDEFVANKTSAFIGSWPNPEHNVEYCQCRYGTCKRCLKRNGVLGDRT